MNHTVTRLEIVSFEWGNDYITGTLVLHCVQSDRLYIHQLGMTSFSNDVVYLLIPQQCLYPKDHIGLGGMVAVAAVRCAVQRSEWRTTTRQMCSLTCVKVVRSADCSVFSHNQSDILEAFVNRYHCHLYPISLAPAEISTAATFGGRKSWTASRRRPNYQKSPPPPSSIC